jgi:hypothetical protein
MHRCLGIYLYAFPFFSQTLEEVKAEPPSEFQED